MQTPGTLADAVERAAEQALREALKQGDGSPTRAARILGVSRPTVYRLMERHGIELQRVIKPAQDIPDLVA
jgi:two-component system NtrC family response regulator